MSNVLRAAPVLLAAALAACSEAEHGLRSLAVTPAQPTLAAGTGTSLRAMGTYWSHTTRDLSESVAWASSDAAVATVDDGVVASHVAGSATITATDLASGLAASVELTVTSAVLTSLALTPTLPQIARGTDVAFTAMGTFSDGTVQDLSASVLWSSSNATVAFVIRGVVEGMGVGVATIAAIDTNTGVSGWTPVLVTPAELVSIDVQPAASSVALGTAQVFSATGTFTDSTTQDLTTSALWSSSNGAVATVSNAPGSEGRATTLSVGTTTVSATDPLSAIQGATAFSVTPAVLVSLAVTPVSPSLALGTSQEFVATGTYSDMTTQDLTTSVTWSSSDPAVASVSNAASTEGVATSLAVGTTTVTAIDPASGIDDGTLLTVTPAVLVSIDVAPTTPSIALGTSQAFVATGTYSDMTAQDLTASVTWSSSDPGVAAVSNAPGTAGLATSMSVGSTTVTALDPASAIDGATLLTVTPAALVSLAVTPSAPSVALGRTQAFAATGTYTDGSMQDLTAAVTWSSSSPAVAAISNASGSEGRATTLSTGATTVTATHAATGTNDAATLTVTPAVLDSITLSPTDPSIALGTTRAFTATGTFSDGSMPDLTDSVTWSSSSPAVATISNAGGSEGLATSAAVGVTTVTATDAPSGIDASTTLTVTPAALVSIAVTPQDWSVPVGSTRSFTALGTYTDASTQDLTTTVTWSSTLPGVATVSNAGGFEGVATGVSAGTTTLTATDAPSGIDGPSTLTVIPEIALRDVASAGAASGVLDVVIATPAGTQPGDVLVAAIAVRPSSATITAPTGWSLVRRIDNGAGNANSLALYTRVAEASEPFDHTWSFSASTGSAGAIAAFEGADPTNPVDVEGGQSTASSVSHTAPSITTTVARTMLVSVHAFASSEAWTPPAGMTEAAEAASLSLGNAAGISLELNVELQPAAGATGVRTATAADSADTGNAALLALSPGA